ncbi:MAG: aminotransferase class I/II-fold pyridoxal phosphate-dependent enzyme [Solirubrobacterales bacterium]
MGLLDYYRQFDDMSESEVNERLRDRRAEEKALALVQVPVLDLSGTEWTDLPDAEVVGASVFQARGRLNSYPDREATDIRRMLAERHYIKAAQIVFGNGSAELLQTAAYLLLGEGDELVTPWPSYSLYASITARARAPFVPVELRDGGIDADGVLAAVGPRTRIVTICNPNDPTGTYLRSEQLGSLLSALPAHVHVLLDEAYVHFQDEEEEDSCLRLVEAFPRLLVFRTFSKIYGLSGLRGGYVVGSSQGADLLAALAPMLGVNALTQAAVAQALGAGTREALRRREAVIAERGRLREGLERLGLSAPPTQANFIWLHVEGMDGERLAQRLEQGQVLVAHGGPLGDGDHVRAAIRDGAATDRLLWALEQAIGNY